LNIDVSKCNHCTCISICHGGAHSPYTQPRDEKCTSEPMNKGTLQYTQTKQHQANGNQNFVPLSSSLLWYHQLQGKEKTNTIQPRLFRFEWFVRPHVWNTMCRLSKMTLTSKRLLNQSLRKCMCRQI
jgi:hypothetical protein